MKIHIFVFLIKKGKFFIKSYENVRKRQEYHQKNINSERVDNKNYLKTEKKKHKQKLSMFICTSNIDQFNYQQGEKLLS